jgi:hypothetical protein
MHREKGAFDEIINHFATSQKAADRVIQQRTEAPMANPYNLSLSMHISEISE